MSNGSNSNNTRIPPQSVEAEESVLGGILIDNEIINDALEIITANDFYRSSHKAIFAGMLSLYDKQDPIDIITLQEQLKAMGTFEDCGGAEYLARLASKVPTAANVVYYAKLVKQTSLRRMVIHQATTVISDAFNFEGELDDFLDSTEQKILGISENRIKPSFSKVSEVVQDSIKLIETLYDRKEAVTGIASKFTDLDKMTAGFQPSDLIILAARPSMGKTALSLCITQNVGIQLNKPVAFFSLEMSKEQLVLRMLCSEAQVDASKVRTGHLGESDFPRLVDAASKIAEAPIYIDDTPALTVTEIRAKARRLHREAKLSMVVVDYLQLVRSPAFSKSREQEIADISRSLKALAKELAIPVIALSQLNRSLENRNDKRPIMSDLRESGAIEQDADIIMFIYRDEVYSDDTQDRGIAEVIISKQRNGPTGVIKLAFLPEYTSFRNLEIRQDIDSYMPEGFSDMDDGISELDGDDFF